jgi:DNA polymerase-3 subunit alpha
MPSKFVHLHAHSHYSLLEALPKVKKLIAQAQAHGMDALAITDNGVLYGAIEFYQKAVEAGIKPILGMDAYIAKDGRAQKRARIDSKPARLVLLAETNEGYRNLVKISTIGFLEGFYYKPRVDKEVLRQYGKGLIALSGGFQGEIEESLRNGAPDKARAFAKEYNEMFGQGNFFLELVDRPEIPEQEATNAQMVELGKELGIPVVASKNAFYLKPRDVEAWKILNCIKGGKTLEDFERVSQFDYDASLVSGEYMEERFADVPEAIENTRRIADRCAVTLDLGKWNFADFKIPEGKTFLDVLRERAFAEIVGKMPEMNQTITDRLNYELGVIDQKGFAPYFLIVSDYIEWARKNGIVTTTRGSAAGSLVSYAIGISTIDPLHYRLPFERFLNPERPSAPDVDGDFADNRRDEVIEYVRGKYGHDKVAQICTFGTMLARGSVRDVGRALGENYGFVDQIAKLVPMGSQGFPMTLERALVESPDLKKLYDTNATVRRVVELAKQIEGCARHVSVHAAGTVFSPTPLTDFTPLQIDTKEGKVITQYEMKSVEAAGLLKMDFLGIRNLSILGDAIKLVKITKDADIVLEKIPVDDAKTFDLLARGYTMGTFQLNGDGMTKYLMDLKPSRVEDIMVMVALYRPGPIESIPEYIKRKHDPKLASFLDPRLKEILEPTYGVIVYQDDVMLIAIKLAGYSWLEADKLRKAMGKKIPEEMAAQKEKLHKGFVQHGLSEKKAQELWKLIEPFAAYGFNKAHAASYGMIAYDTAYMKANFPCEYMTALMTAESADIETVAIAVKECRRMGIDVLPPDLNESLPTFTFIDDTHIRFGLVAIKNLGEEVIDTIIAERKRGGPFVDLADFANRVHHRAFNKKSLEALIKTGALDRFGERKRLLENMDRILMANKTAAAERAQNQASLFAGAPSVGQERITLREVAPASSTERLAWEKELLGLFVSGHPYAVIEKLLAGQLLGCRDVEKATDGAFVRCGGIITDVKLIQTKKGETMAFVGLEDLAGKTEVVVFPRTYVTCKDLLVPDLVVVVSAKVSKRPEDDGAKLLANSFVAVAPGEEESVARMLHDGMWVPGGGLERVERVEKAERDPYAGTLAQKPAPREPLVIHKGLVSIALTGRPTPDMIERLRELFRAAPGKERVCFLVEAGGGVRCVETDYCVERTPQLIDEIAAVVGRQNVRVE